MNRGSMAAIPEPRLSLSRFRPPKTKERMNESRQCKDAVDGFLRYKAIIHHEYAPPGQTLNKKYFMTCCGVLRDASPRKRTELHASREWQRHHENESAHSAPKVQQFSAKANILQVRQTLYSPDLAHCRLFIFPKIKTHFKRIRFKDTEKIEENATKQLLAILKTEFYECFRQ